MTEFTALTPMLETRDFARTLNFYVHVLGFECKGYEENWWACLRRDNVEIMFSAPNEHRNIPNEIMSGSLYFRVDNVDQLWAELKDKAPIGYDLENFDYGMREFAIYDNNGYLLQFGQEIGRPNG